MLDLVPAIFIKFFAVFTSAWTSLLTVKAKW